MRNLKSMYTDVGVNLYDYCATNLRQNDTPSEYRHVVNGISKMDRLIYSGISDIIDAEVQLGGICNSQR